MVTLLVCLQGLPAGAATATLENLDGDSVGFNDPTVVEAVGGNTATTLGAQRVFVFERAAGLWADELVSEVAITIGASFEELTCTADSAQLAAAAPTTVKFGTDLSDAPFDNTVYAIALANSLTGEDLCPESGCAATHYDIEAQFNISMDAGDCLGGVTFYYGIDGNAGSNQIDFLSTVLHELAHGLGFMTFVNLATGAKFSATAGNDTYYFDDPYMHWMEDHSELLRFPDMSDTQRLAAITDDGDLHWAGSYGTAAAAGLSAGRDPSSGHVGMYAPAPAESGSSLSHVAEGVTPDELMEPTSTETQDLTITRAMLRDTGWRLSSAIPCGDVTGEGDITVSDALAILKTAVGIVVELTCSPTAAVCGDVTGEGDVTVSDALAVLKTAVGISVELTCSAATTTTTLPPAATWTEVLAVFSSNNCNVCHGSGASGGLTGLNDSSAGYAALVGAAASGCSGKTLVVASDPDSSYLIEKVEQSAPTCGDQMPTSPFTALSAADIETIRSWISGGAVKD